ncbi:APC family permease [Halocatena halophila]|uniref:APC family permease n=1 Tax=Halocatena halophila TaxID=2814576 RepID=UPI002ED0E148
MGNEKIGLWESISMAIGGMVGGGIFAALGIVAVTARTLAWLAFIVAGVIALCAGYSFIRLNDCIDGHAGPITYVDRFTGNTTLAGMLGWTFIIGYIGTMALYSYAFGGYFTDLIGVQSVGGVPLRPVITAIAVLVFVGLNTAGAHASGSSEDVLVGLKIAILLVFGVGGIYFGFQTGQLTSGLSNVGGGPVIAAGVAFVAFEGWELLLFDQGSIENPHETVKKAIYVAIVGATLLYVLVAVVTTNLVSPMTIQQQPDTALAIAAQPFLGPAGFVLISVAALFSTGSALNATLFSGARLTETMVREEYLPDELSSETRTEPVRALIVIGVLTAALAVLGSLNAISSFASLSFIVIFGSISALAVTQRDSVVNTIVPAIGVVGALAAAVALLYHLFTSEFETFILVFTLALAVIIVELLYFERKSIYSKGKRLEHEL